MLDILEGDKLLDMSYIKMATDLEKSNCPKEENEKKRKRGLHAICSHQSTLSEIGSFLND